MTPQPQPPSTPTTGLRAWIHLHLPALLYAWFWFGMFLCGLLAPPDRVVELYKSTRKRARLAGWVLLFYALWHRRHIEQRRPEGDVFDVLSAV